MIAQPTDDLLERASAGFDVFAKAGEVPARQAQFSEELAHQAQKVAGAAARLFATDDGKEVLEYLLEISLRRPVWTAALGLAADQAQLHGVLREGQNSLAWHLLTLIAQGREATRPVRGKEGL